MDRWRGKIAIVTGASSGIGAAICENLVRAGIQVVGLARRSDRIMELAKKVNTGNGGGKSSGGKLFAFKTDMTNENDIVKAFEWTSKNLGPLHILINNAGVLPETGLLDGDASKWKLVFDTNVIGLCVCSREATRIMSENKINGHIIHVNSIFGHINNYIPGMNVYPASKHAVTNLTDQMRQELRTANSKIKISSVSPGYVDTEILNGNPMKSVLKDAPCLQSQDIADAVVYMLGTPPHVQVHDLIIKPLGELC